ncbi:MAG: methyltransferase [Pseudomonadota bacterium]
MDGPLLALNAPAAPGLVALLGTEATVFAQRRFSVHQALKDEGAEVVTRPEGPFAAAVVFPERSAAASLGLVAEAAARAAGGRLIVTGPKSAGIEPLLAKVAAEVPELGRLAKAHGKAAWFDLPSRRPAELDAWAAAVAPAPVIDGFVAAPGMFSADGPDPGSAALAIHLDARIKGRVAELGAGWGWLSAQIAECAPGMESLDVIEDDAAALDAARTNLADPRARFHWADVTTLKRPGDGYDWIVMNPPFHQGREADPGLGQAFIAAAARLLGPRGRLLMVANRHLPYEATLRARFAEIDLREQDRRYKIVEAARPTAQRRRRA